MDAQDRTDPGRPPAPGAGSGRIPPSVPVVGPASAAPLPPGVPPRKPVRHVAESPAAAPAPRDPAKDTVPRGISAIDEAAAPVPPAKRPEMIIVTGMSGAGRSRAANALEDLDWYVVDNLPPQLLPALAGMMTTVGAGVHRLAAVVDVRSREFFASFMKYLGQLRDTGVDVRLIFLDASDAVLIRRFESSRRPHPLQGTGSILDGIEHERTLLAGLKGTADEVINTTDYSVHDLARRIRELVAHESDLGLRVTVMSFGFKYGLPMDADHVLDVRFIPNPYWVSELRHLTGRDAPVADYVFQQDGAAAFVDGYVNLLIPALPRYVDELKPSVTIAVGCTGGKHRSVATAERIGASLRAAGFKVAVQHRDLGRE
ncbi:RNase adapter RapZ [Actinomyces ruminis]|uniref:RNase adapter RapZ n=1 Tax=Actinomyces ruminis TaxID=1937003 RepID=A0ABX4M9D6_9ACTO|nr:RNase adapter RapZ [Actinomyces ruminis]PHP52069.1 RNase adapter RapZ [Actinomyces ruminis]